MSTKDRLKNMGIKLGFQDTDSLGSFGDNASTGYDDYNDKILESDDDEGDFDQSDLKGRNLYGGTKTIARREMTRGQRIQWLNDDGN